MPSLLERLLDERPWLLADGATGTNYFAAGLETGDAPELWNFKSPERVKSNHRSFVEAGSDIILTNSFGGTANRLKLHKAEDRSYEINKCAAELAREAADAAKRQVVVAGSMGPTGELFEPLGPLTFETGKMAFQEQACGLKDGGVDVLWIETISSIEELKAAASAAIAVGLPYVSTLSFDTNGRTMMGVTPADFAKLAHEFAPSPLAYGGNCGTGAAELVAAICNMSEAAEPNDVLVAKSNCGIPEYVDGAIRYSGTPTLMAAYVHLAIDSGARIIGGCCGTTADHIRAMRAAMDSHPGKGERPSLPAIEAKLGKITTGAQAQAAGPLGTLPDGGDNSDRPRRRGRRGTARN